MRRGAGPQSGLAPPTAVEGARDALRLAGPALLKPALEALATVFAEQHPEASVTVVDSAEGAEASVVLALDGPASPPADAAGEHVADLNVVIAAKRGNPLKVKSADQLAARRGLRIAVPDAAEDAAGAVYAKWSEQAKGLAPTVVPVSTEVAACEAVCAGEADLAVTYAPRVMFGDYANRLCIAFYLDRETADPVRLLAAPAANAGPAARECLAFMTSGRGQATFRRFGLEPVRQPSPTDAEKSLFIPCGAGLQPAMDRLGDVYFERTGVRADFSYAGSGMLLAQLNFTRRGDLYMPGEGFWVTLAERRGFVADKTPVVYFVPVIGVPKGNPKDIRSLSDLARPGVRVCLGDPEALAVGPVTVHILERAGLLEKVRANVAMMCGCIPELANAISMKSADAGIIWDAVAYQYRDEIDAVGIPVELNEAAEVLISTLKVSRQPEEARRFMEFVASEEAAEIFRAEGFLTEKPEGMRIAPQDAPGG